MVTPTETPSGDLQETMRRLAGNAERLEVALDQTLQLLKKRGITPSVDLVGMMRTVRRDVMAAERTARQDSGQLHQLQELVRTAALINSSLELDRVLEEVMDTVIHLTDAERGYLMLRDANSGELSIRTARNYERESLLDDSVIFSRGIANTAIAEGRPILTNDSGSDPRFGSRQTIASINAQGVRSILCVPLNWRGQVVGLLYADKLMRDGIFTPDILPILGAFASQAAIAIENARLFMQVRADLHRAEREVMELRIQIDERKKEEQVKAITDSEYFQYIESQVRNLRRRPQSQPNTDESSGG
jgi:GAF domain-containing protein